MSLIRESRHFLRRKVGIMSSVQEASEEFNIAVRKTVQVSIVHETGQEKLTTFFLSYLILRLQSFYALLKIIGLLLQFQAVPILRHRKDLRFHGKPPGTTG